MADPACKDCKHFYQPPLTSKGGECMDRTKRIYPRRTAASEVDAPWIHDEEIYTCGNWTEKDTANKEIQYNVRTVPMKSLDVAVSAGWHEIHDAKTGEIAVRLELRWMRDHLTAYGKRDVAGPGLYAKGPFGIELYGDSIDGVLGVSVSLPDRTDKEGYTFAFDGEWIVRLAAGEVVVRKNWSPSYLTSDPAPRAPSAPAAH